MGFRSTIVSQDSFGKLPDWFTEKYKGYILFPNAVMVASKHEAKFYTNDFFKDYQKALIEIGLFDRNFNHSIVIVVLAEDGVVTKVKINSKTITFYQMVEMVEIDKVWQGY